MLPFPFFFPFSFAGKAHFFLSASSALKGWPHQCRQWKNHFPHFLPTLFPHHQGYLYLQRTHIHIHTNTHMSLDFKKCCRRQDALYTQKICKDFANVGNVLKKHFLSVFQLI
ncbi:hypothetical protein XENORESO_015659 [Xenotaenia resolanae]|uniref:Secreted protein n=1 Tax=Xenotaenia resolanae TaxID=208358 RepID=A0ABV0VX28_9TELE